ncbi:FMN-binding negative transcriptional regulator [Qipengyuania sphaerica]|uniref:FMN-binding negative transcriptional regulator n=1 Tax=Qipengyuania sphaerica TaxID=2867243 RepID=UPI001C8811DA|nr:FMN-binding negative transcriptional regulator [Qipengyuania sphaerica]MBX7539933.1 FMN-binding negative transcriptional regulator [Qipengyuania sphaerica]
MHPNPLFRSEDKDLMRALVEEIGFGMVFLTTPDGPRVAHTPLLWGDYGKLRFHLARGNALTKHLDGATALVTLNGPDAYVSPRWYENRDTVPTWDYVALEMEGRVVQLDEVALDAFLYDLIDKHENRLAGEGWDASEASESMWKRLLAGIRGFELEVTAWRPTLKLSQKKTAEERARIALGLEQSGSAALAHLMRELAA